MSVLRPYQSEIVDMLIQARKDGMGRAIVEGATALGKTRMFAAFTKYLVREANGFVLINVDRKEIVEDIFAKVVEYGDFRFAFGDVEIGIERASQRASRSCRVIVASIQSMTEERVGQLFEWFWPTDIITDEAQRAGANQNKRLYEMAGVNRGECNHWGFTATPERGDKQALYELDENDKPFMLEKGRSKRLVPASPGDCIFKKLLIRRNFYWGGINGWLVDGIFWPFESPTSLEGLPLGANGDFKTDELSKRINNADRTNGMISAYKQQASGRQFIDFCADVVHAHDSADLWAQAGFDVAAIDGKTPELERESIFRRYRAGKLLGITNCDVIDKGIDVPTCSCICWSRPTKSRVRVVQGIGRGLRVLPGVVDTDLLRTAEPEFRRRAIAESSKPNCIILDPVDAGEIYTCHAHELIGIPSNVIIQGVSLIEVKQKIDEFCEKTGRDIGKCPLDYKEVEVILKRHVDFAHVKINKSAWQPSDKGYHFNHTPPGYVADMVISDTGRKLVITHGKSPIKELPVPAENKMDTKALLHKSASLIFDTVRDHMKANPKELGTFNKLSKGQQNVLTYFGGYKKEDIDCWPMGKAKAVVGSIMQKKNAAKGHAQ